MSGITIRIAQLAVLLVLGAAGPAFAQSQIVSQTGIVPSAEDLEAVGGIHAHVNFGAAVALSGSTAAVGIPHDVEEQSLPGPGRVGIYRETKAGWIRTATLLPSNPNDFRLGHDLDLCGNLAIVAAENSTYVFQRRGVHWREIKRISPPSPDSVPGPVVCSSNSFAQSFSKRDDQGQSIAGRVYVYERARGGDFELAAKLRASDPNDSIGRSLAMERGIVVAGSESESAYVFVRHGGRWIERQKLQTAAGSGSFGAAVGIRDRIIIVGAPNMDVPGGLPFWAEGDAFVYLPHRGMWFESQRLNPPLPELLPSSGFGSKVEMGRRFAAIGVPVTAADQIRPQSVVTVFERIGVEFTPRHAGVSAGPDNETIPDFDMSGRRLIASEHVSLLFNDRIIGRVTIVEFEPSSEPATQTDEEEMNEEQTDED